MNMQPKKTFAVVNYKLCRPGHCDPDKGRCASAAACSRKVIKQIDGTFEPPVIFLDLCMGCRDCLDACPLNAVAMKQVS